MRCAWCHNPETLSTKPQLQFFKSKCIGCKGCEPRADTASAKPRDCLTDKSGNLRHYRGNCHAKALVQVGRTTTPEAVVAEVMQDNNFYHTSGGGLTISGGEVGVQADFAYDTLRLAKDKGVHTAIETNVACSWGQYEKLLPVLDLVMFDIKSMDSDKHQVWTGVGTERILENADRLSVAGIPLIVRTPVIPGFNDTVEEIVAIAEHIRPYAELMYYELLAFNPLGADKYKCLGMPYAMGDAKLVPGTTMREMQVAASETGTEVRVG